MQERNQRTKRTVWVVIFLVVLSAFAVYISFSAGTPSEDVVPAPPLIMTPLHNIVLGAIAVIAVGVLFFLNSRYGPLITFIFGARAQRSPWRNLTLLFIAAAVMVVLYGIFVRSAPTSQSYEPLPQQASPYPIPRWFNPFILIGAGGAVAVSLTNLALMRYGIPPLNEKTPMEQLEEITSQDESLPPKVSSLANEINSLGFSELAHCRVLLPGGRELSRCLLFASREHKTVAGIVWSQQTAALGTVFTSFFSNNALLETSYPTLSNVNYPYYQASGTNKGLSAAGEQHNRHLETFSNQHGQPVSIDSLHSYLDWSKRTRHLRWQVQGRRMFAFAAAWTTLTLALLGVILVLQSAGNGSAGTATICIFPIVCIVLIGGLTWIYAIVKTVRKMR